MMAVLPTRQRGVTLSVTASQPRARMASLSAVTDTVYRSAMVMRTAPTAKMRPSVGRWPARTMSWLATRVVAWMRFQSVMGSLIARMAPMRLIVLRLSVKRASSAVTVRTASLGHVVAMATMIVRMGAMRSDLRETAE